MRTLNVLLSGTLFCTFLVSGMCQAEGGRDTTLFTGNARVDFFGFRTMTPDFQKMDGQTSNAAPTSRKSPWMAAGLSAVVPGAGEFYANSYVKAGLFLAADLVLWTVASHLNSRGNSQTDYFQNYADAHWSVVAYAKYAISSFNPSVPSDLGTSATWSQLILGDRDGRGLPPWQVVDFAMLNRLESAIGGYYSHNLPQHGDQQYFEEIGKYPQFNMGWDDANQALSSDYESQKANLTANYLYYGTQRGESYTYYKRAVTYVSLAILNHLLSAVDAALTANSYNKVHAEMSIQSVPAGPGYSQVPTVKFTIGL